MEIHVTEEYGHKEFTPVEYRVVSKERRGWWGKKRVWFVETDFVRMGTFDSEADAQRAAERMRSV